MSFGGVAKNESVPPKGMLAMARIAGSLFNSAVWAMMIALVFSKWTWFEMRVNVGWVLFAAWIALFVICLRCMKRPFGLGFIAINALVCGAIIFFLANGTVGIQIIPASLVREGLMHPQWSIGAVNMAMLLFLAISLALAIVSHVAIRNAQRIPPSGR